MDEARDVADRDAAWVRRRYPPLLNWSGDSNASAVAFLTYVIIRDLSGAHRTSIVLWCRWPQLADQLLEDMGLPSNRSGGNWLTWLFKPVDLDELVHLKEERDAMRRALST